MAIAGKSALVTGASEGIGHSIARALVAAGANVVITARREGPLKEAADRLGPAASWVAGDMADETTVQTAVDHAVDRHGGLDLVVCNAGILIPGTLTAQPLAEVDQVIGVNLRGTIALMRAAAPALAGRTGACAVVVSSSIGRQPTASMGVYGATKAALHYLVPTWAIELAADGIRVNAVCAGITDTPGLRGGAARIPGLEQAVIGTNLIKRLATADEIAHPVLTLLDQDVSGYVTGSIWDIDGGFRRDGGGPARGTGSEGAHHDAA
ncbi:SDR family NAD(P)-dependent oxidoreductase [Streptomyces coacervatus]|nr:SDR family oxidoreductase [Streptomyces coacervatus]MDF2269754.1 SDR family NAD(P)-dependent oxidoreductase [Streptomyces coacervatus]